MTQKTALILSVVLTAFVLVVGGGVIARVSQARGGTRAAAPYRRRHVALSTVSRCDCSSAGTACSSASSSIAS